MVYFPLKHKLTKVAYVSVLWFSNPTVRDIPKENAGMCWSEDMYKNFLISFIPDGQKLEITQMWMSDKKMV